MTLSKILDNKEIYNMAKNSIGDCLNNFDKQCDHALFLGRNLCINLHHNVDFIFLCGVGGSGLAGDFIRNISLQYGITPIFVIRNYTLPHFATEKSLIFIISYSGNTEETLNCYEAAKKLKAPLVAVSSGGNLGDLAKKDGTYLIEIPCGFQPRMATLYMALPVLLLLNNEKIIDLPQEEIGEIYFNLCILKKKWGFSTPAIKNRAKATALQLYGKMPIIWGSEDLTDAGAKNMKSQLNETAETPCFCGAIPEVNHNEIMSFGNKNRNFVLLMFRDKKEHPRIAQRFEISENMLKEQVEKIVTFTAQGNSFLSRLTESIYFGDLVGYYLSILNKVNPEEIAMITSFKARMLR
ncbi:MAG: bifunctional phosphoglucose/phosphomannose isomerase [Clostridiales bacterium]